MSIVRVLAGTGLALLFAPIAAWGAPFTEGNLLVSRVGGTQDDLLTFPDSASRVRLLEINPADGSVVQEIRLPALAADVTGPNNHEHRLTLGSDFRAGVLHRSVNGLFLVIGGYDADAKDGTAAAQTKVKETSATVVNRVVARIDNYGVVDTVTAIRTTSGQSPEGLYDNGTNASFAVATVDGTHFYLAGRHGKTSPSSETRKGRVQHCLYGATESNQVPNGSQFNDARGVNIVTAHRPDNLVDLQLVGCFNNLNPIGLYWIGTGVPTGNGETTNVLPSIDGSANPNITSPYDFFMPDPDTVYLCNDDPPSAGIQKFAWDSEIGAYAYRYTLSAGLNPTMQTVRGITGKVDGNGHPVLYSITATNQTTGGDRGNHLMTVTDTGCPTGVEAGCSGPDTFSILTTAGDLEVFRGVAFAPRACVGAECPGACCLAGQACTDGMTESACTAASGVFRGIQTTCALSGCPYICGNPFTDADGDGDADLDDYAQFQLCYSGNGVPAIPGCKCFDRPEEGFPSGDGDVDETDLNAFKTCETRANVPAIPTCDN